MTRVLVWLCCLGVSVPLAAADDGIAAFRRMAAQGNVDAQFAVAEAFQQGGIAARSGTPAQFANFIASEIRRSAEVIRAAGIQAEN